MERSENLKTLDNYERLAYYYEKLLEDDEAFSLWLEYIESYPAKKILELASGNGALANILKEKGYQILASDISKSMQSVAVKRYDLPYLILNMIDFKLDDKFDMILCVCDSINYLSDYEEMKRMFENVYEHLNEGGVFIFDMHHPQRLSEFKEEYIEEGYIDDVAYQWTILADQMTDELLENFIFYEKEGIVMENHCQKVFAIDKVRDLLKASQFEVKVYEDFIKDEKVLFIGEKK